MSGEDNTPDDEEEPGGQPEGQPSGQPQGQPASQPQGQPQTQPAAQAPAQGQRPVRQGPSLTDELQKPASMHWIKYNVAIFLAVGLGYAISFFLFTTFAPSAGVSGGMGGMVGASLAFIMGLFLAPLLAAFNGIRIGNEFHDEQNLVLVNSFIGSAVGFLVMFFVLFILVSAQASGGGGLGDLLGPVFGFLIGVGLTGTLATYAVRWLDGR